MKGINIFFAILVICVATAFAKKVEVPKLQFPDWFRIDTLANGEQIFYTPFAQVSRYSSNFGDHSIIGKFTVVEWDPTFRILKIETSEGEKAVFSERIDTEDWYFVNYLGGILQSETKLTWVGLQMAGTMAKFSSYINGRILQGTIEGEVIIADSGVVGRHLWQERLPVALGAGYKVTCSAKKWVILSLPDGESFSEDTPMGRVKSCCMAFYPNIVTDENGKINPGWSYVMGDTQSGFSGTIAENLSRFLK